MIKRLVFSSLLLAMCGLFTNVAEVYSLSGTAALVTQSSGSVSGFISGRHSPYAEVVVIDAQGKVVAAALDQGQGNFSFNFRSGPSQANGLRLFAVDKAASTNPISIPSSGILNVLLPPTIVVDPGVETDENDLAVGGYSYPGATVTLLLEGDKAFFETDVVEAEADGGWTYVYRDVEPGSYNLEATSQVDGLSSNQSFSLDFVVEEDEPDPVVEEVAETVTDVVENVAEVVLPPAVKEVAREVAPEVEQVNRAVTPVASASLLTQLALVGRDLLYWLFQGMATVLQYFGFWRKRRPWGVVYDAFTKQPVMLATVRLYSADSSHKLVETDVTSKAGVFSFFPEAGKYIIKVAKTGYGFPSNLVKGNNDGEYGHVYHGEEVEFRGEGSVVEVSVPVDPAEVNISWRFKVINFLRTRMYLFTLGMLVIGLVLSLVALAGGGGPFNAFMLLFYSIVLLVQGYLAYRRNKAWGIVVDAEGTPIPGVQLSLMDPKFEKLVQRRVTDEKGKYQFVIPEGTYQIKVESVEYNLITGLKDSYQGEDIIVQGTKPKLVAVKIVVGKS